MFEVGDRVEVGNERCTIRWIGVVEESGEWLGVEWDKLNRGKHDGEHKDKSYFKPIRSGRNCSFIRKGKVSQHGIGLLEAVKNRYGEVEGKTAGVEQKEIEDLQAEIGARFVEVVGFDKVNKQQSRIKGLKTVSVRNMGVSGRDDADQDLSSELPSLRDLDLSESLISSWNEVFIMCNQLKLHTLDVSNNLLPTNTIQLTKEKNNTLKHLVAGNMLYSGYSWEDVTALVSILPSLTVIQLHKNNISTIKSVDLNLFSSLSELDLDGNNLQDWSDVDNLSDLPQLKDLRLNGNKIANIDIKHGSFKQLRSLQLSDNCLTNWKCVGMLDRLRLSELRMRNNPVHSSCKDEDVARAIMIARISSITHLNGTQISVTERKYAEIDYLKMHGQQWLALSKEDPGKDTILKDFLDNNNRYDKIVQTYGEPEAGDGAKADTTLKASLVKLKVRSPQVIGSAETIKKVPMSMSVAKLRALLYRLYKDQAGGSKLRISLVSSANQNQEIDMDNDMREVSFYSVSEGDTLLVRWGEEHNRKTTVTDL